MLLTCPDCGNEVSDQAPACPKCGRPTARAAAPASKTTLTKPAGCFLQLLAIVVFVVGVGLCLQGGAEKTVFGFLVVAGAAWLFIVGRRPALK